MVKQANNKMRMQTTYYLKPGQSLENTKIADRSLALMVSKSAFDRFVDYTTENERLAAAAEQEEAKLEALKKSTYEMSKTWNDTIANIKKRRKEEIMNRSKRAEEARVKFVKDLKTRNAIERAKVVNEARKLLLWKKPQCRLINGALLTSECYRQLDAQLAFEKTLKDIDKKRDIEYATMMKRDYENSMREEKSKAEEKMKKNRAYGKELQRQIEGFGNDLKRMELEELRVEKEDLKNMAKEIRMVEECDAEQTSKRKKELMKIFKDALEDKKRRELEIEKNEKFENRALEVFAKSKDRIKEIGKMRAKEAMDEKIRYSDSIARRCAAVRHSNESTEEENRKKAVLEKEKLEREKREAKIKHEENVRSDMKKYRAELAEIKNHFATEEKNMIAWETLQRFKRDEYNKEILMEQKNLDTRKKLEMANYLRKQMAEREAEQQREGTMGDDAKQTKEMIQRTNEKVLAYGEQVLNECRELNESNPEGPARPLFPIIKAIEQFKKDSGLIPPKPYEEGSRPKRKQRKRPVCANPLPPDQIYYL